MTPADTPRTERYHLRSCEVNSAYAPNTPRELIGTKMCDCGLDKAIDAYATDRVEQAVVEALREHGVIVLSEDGQRNLEKILTPPPTNGEETGML